MYLKTIEMRGFKSFAERTRIELNRDFTAIVGPNGSGKSNITEAIKWVLGEQSAKSLRGERMDDVIFAGTETKRKGQYAEVSLEFDNSDETLPIDSELVRITRRLTRGGDSNYMINGRNCRLKDITDLMLDTGIGRHSFSVISQGRVEEIFNQRAEDRREIFEEAAGVMKYKSRRREAARKLEHALANQHRLDDIIQEIETRLAPLKQQHDDALKYRELTDTLRSIDIQVLVQEIETAVAARKYHEDAQQQLSNQISEAEQQQQQIKQKLKTTRKDKDTAEVEQEDLHQNVVTLVAQIEQLQSEERLAEQRHDFEQQSQKEQQQRQDELREQREALENKKTQLEEDIETFEAKVKTLNQEKKSLDVSAQNLEANATEDIDTLRNQYFDYLQSQNQLKNRIALLKQEQSVREQRTMSRQQRQSEAERTKRTLLEKQAAHEDKMKEAAQLLNEAVANNNTYQQSLDTQSEQLRAAKQQLETIENAIVRSKTTRDSLQRLSDGYEGFYNGVKNALKWGENHVGVAGAVAELIRVPQKYTRAVEEALGGQMQNIVVDNGDVAEAAIAHLKTSGGGRATFLPLDHIRGRQLNSQIVNQAKQVRGFIDVLSDLVDYDAYLAPVIQYLMGSILVTDNIGTARRINQMLRRGARIVTLDGDIVNAGGALTGGRNRHNPQHELLIRGQRIAEEEKQLQSLTAERQKQRTACERQQVQVGELREQLNDTQGELITRKRSLEELRAQQETLTKQLKDVSEQLQAEKYDDATDTDDEREAQQQLAEAQEKIIAFDEKIKALREKIENFDQYAKARETKRNEIAQQRQTLLTTLAIQKEKLSQKRAQYDELTDQLKTVQESEQTLTAQITDKVEATSHYDSDQAKRRKLLATKQQTHEQLLQAQQDLKQRLGTLTQSLDASNEKLATVNATLTRQYQQQSGLESAISRDNEKIDNYLVHLSEDYTLTYERAKKDVEPLKQSIPEAKQKMRTLRQSITALGAVNLQAIDEYESVSERYRFMTKQREDVLAAVDNLNEAIRSLDDEVRTKFGESFQAIRASFEDIFPKLFNGGKATLTLTDPDDLLNTGIEIMAQPPGKQLQLMSLLSGGERSLTAIALLFAIIAVNTVPFSILDEVEAALDDANVARYGQYLQQYADQTQFIVITHRKGTMVHANVLYGVTMEEAGVSKLAAVKLTDIED
ncbi:MAG: chromosome segregation protein SMC [Aerococcus sp.]|nr:chromosome segregation protein SMC [Aerococcus sp.]